MHFNEATVKTSEDDIRCLVFCLLDEIAPLLTPSSLTKIQKSLGAVKYSSQKQTKNLQQIRDEIEPFVLFLGEENHEDMAFLKLFDAVLEESKTEGLETDMKPDCKADKLEKTPFLVEQIEIIEDIESAFGLSLQSVMAVSLLYSLRLKNKQVVSNPALLDEWIVLGLCSNDVKDLWLLKDWLLELSSSVCSVLKGSEAHRLFCAWYLSFSFARGVRPEGFARRILETLLSRAKLAPLIVFEEAGLLT